MEISVESMECLIEDVQKKTYDSFSTFGVGVIESLLLPNCSTLGIGFMDLVVIL